MLALTLILLSSLTFAMPVLSEVGVATDGAGVRDWKQVEQQKQVLVQDQEQVAAANEAAERFFQNLQLQRLIERALEQRGHRKEVGVAPAGLQRASWHEIERRSLANLPVSSQFNALDQLSTIEALMLDSDGSISRLGRAYKPKIMSTARGFGKRSLSYL